MLSKTLVTLAVLASSAFATITFTSAPSTVVAGQTYTLTYSSDDATNPVQIVLRQGNPADLTTVGTITSAATGGSYSWTVPSDITSGTNYALEIIQGTDTNYFGPFSCTGGTGASSAASSAASVTASSGSSSASSLLSSALTISAKSTSTHVSNSTTTSTKSSVTTSLSTSKITSAGSSATATSAPNGASSISSPLALILGAVAAMFYLH